MNCMATLKHIASKNSDYTAIEAYLIYQHDIKYDGLGYIPLDELEAKEKA